MLSNVLIVVAALVVGFAVLGVGLLIEVLEARYSRRDRARK